MIFKILVTLAVLIVSISIRWKIDNVLTKKRNRWDDDNDRIFGLNPDRNSVCIVGGFDIKSLKPMIDLQSYYNGTQVVAALPFGNTPIEIYENEYLEENLEIMYLPNLMQVDKYGLEHLYEEETFLKMIKEFQDLASFANFIIVIDKYSPLEIKNFDKYIELIGSSAEIFVIVRDEVQGWELIEEKYKGNSMINLEFCDREDLDIMLSKQVLEANSFIELVNFYAPLTRRAYARVD